MVVSGSLILGSTDDPSTADGSCSGNGGYSDIQEGASIVIRDSNSKKIALGRLHAGHPADGESRICEFPFLIKDVKSGDDIYSIEVSHRGEISFKPAESRSIVLSLGP